MATRSIPFGGSESNQRVGVFALIGVLLLLLVYAVPVEWQQAFNLLSAKATHLLLVQLGVATLMQGTLLQVGDFQANIITECSVLYPCLLFSALVLAYPAKLWQRCWGVLTGTLVLFALNTVRLAVVILAGESFPRFFEIAHVYFGQIFMVLSVGMLCYGWLYWVSGNLEKLPALSFWARLAATSLVLFVPWLLLNRHYVGFSDIPVSLALEWIGRPVNLEANKPLYYQAFNVVTFVSLIVASKVGVRRGAKLLALGLVALSVGHMLFRGCNALMTAYDVGEAFYAANAVFLIGQYLLPVALWLLMTGSGLLKRTVSEVQKT